MKDTVLVVPSIREDCINNFLERWNAIGLSDCVDIIVMEDNPTKTFKLDDNIIHYSWEKIEKDLDKVSWIIPRRSDTVRSYAYFSAQGEGWKYIMTLDDDCYPPTEEDGFQYQHASQFVNAHKNYLNGRSKWMSTLSTARPRGLPYYNLGLRDDVIVNHGLWTNVIDYDAANQLANPVKEEFDFSNKLVPSGTYFPMCGMNVMWKADYTVWMYHLLMGKKINKDGELEQLPFDRFGDIWCGILMKKCADVMEKSVSTGTPYIRHERASNPFTNLKKEANGIEVNEKFWEIVDKFEVNVDAYYGGLTPATLYIALTKWTFSQMAITFPEYEKYFKTLQAASYEWSTLYI